MEQQAKPTTYLSLAWGEPLIARAHACSWLLCAYASHTAQRVWWESGYVCNIAAITDACTSHVRHRECALVAQA